MDASQSQTKSQISQMEQFILNEAKDKAEEITTKALQEFRLEKLKVSGQMKEKIHQEFEKKSKQLDTQAAIARSSAINKSRLDKIKARQEVLGKISDDTKANVLDKLKDASLSKQFITKLIVQGLLMLLEDVVEVRCRASDDAVVSACLADAAAEYSKVVQAESGATKKVNITLDKVNKLSPAPVKGSHDSGCLGGVVLACQNGSITIDNTIDSRLNLVLEQAKPTIRGLLFSA
eukprot:TRINITY_DN2660_c0_g1_i1.p1 TRINITY_DN2660_c0_g1~~TRINITY_DN2660_c0_g1_i1.p1  ORF type:complete len:234 (+),score=59.34 TRINITY_DN2660_c0_g1_i1:77-778(+)